MFYCHGKQSKLYACKTIYKLDGLQCIWRHCNISLKSVSLWQVTQLFTYLLTQRRTAATPTSVCLLLRHDSARRQRQ